MRGMCHNANMKGLIKDIWTCIEDLLREAYKYKQAKPGKRIDVALGLAPWFAWYHVEMMKCAQKRGCQREDWWAHYGLPNIDELPRAVLPPIPDNRPGSIPLPSESSQGARTSKSDRGEPKERQRAKSGGSPGATPRRSGQAASTSAADLRESSRDNPEVTEPARQVKIQGDGSEATREAGRQCRRARGETSPSGDWSGLPGYLGPRRAKSMGRKGPRNPPREGMPLTHQRDRSMGRAGPRIRPRDDDVGGHPA